MADISQEIAAIQSASRGSEVRSPIVDALNKMNAATLPAVSSSDSKKLLCVNAQGQWVASNEQYVPTPTGSLNISENGTYNVADKAQAVVNVQGGITPTGTIQITQNGTYDVTDKASAEVNVQGGSAVLVPKTITQNGTYDPASDNADGYSGVTVNVPSGGTLIQKTITQNGTYNASSDNADGYSQVTVNVQGGGSELLGFDFTKYSGRVHSVDFSNEGAVFSGNGLSYIEMATLPQSNNFTIEIDVSLMQLTAGAHRRFAMVDTNHGFIFRNVDDGVWSLYSGSSWATDSVITDGSYFDDSVVSIYIDSNNFWHIYKDGVIAYEPDIALAITSARDFMIGSSSTSIGGAKIKSAKIYQGLHLPT